MYRNFQNISSDSERLIDQIKSIEAVESNFNLFSLPLTGSACVPNPHGGVELQLFLVSTRREDTVPLAAGPLEFEGPAVPGTANTKTPVRQHLDVPQVERTAGVRAARSRGWEEIVSERYLSQSSQLLVSVLTHLSPPGHT